MEIVDVHGNVHKSDIQQVYVGACNGCAVEGGGCMDPAANNYDAAATSEDETCVYDFTVRVDMSNEGGASAVGVHIAGEFQGWNPAGTPLTDEGDGIWAATVEVPAGSFQCKFLNGNAWGEDESVPSACADGIDRFHTAGTTDQVLDPVCFGTCTTCMGPDPDPTCLGDLNGDGMLNVPDMLTLLADFGCTATCASDLDNDGSVTVSDILALLTLFGETCP